MRVKLVSGLLGFILIFSGLVGLMADRTVLAAQEGSGGSFLLPPGQEQPEEKLELESQYTVLRDRSGAGFEFLHASMEPARSRAPRRRSFGRGVDRGSCR